MITMAQHFGRIKKDILAIRQTGLPLSPVDEIAVVLAWSWCHNPVQLTEGSIASTHYWARRMQEIRQQLEATCTTDTPS